VTQQLRTHLDGWRSLVGLSDAQAAELIRQDRIDLLVDLAGHSAGNRLPVFARKPAPVQATWLGYPNTTGLDTVDYRLTDALADPVGQTDLHYSEALIRLSPCAWCFAPGASLPVAARREGPVTFGCFNNFAKVTDPLLALWGRILQAAPDSRLLLKARGLSSETARLRVRQHLGALGIAPERLELRGYTPDHRGHLALYAQMDIALDTFPYHGTTTTCEALWMGVPVVTLAGSAHVSRVGVSLLCNAGLPELVAATPEDYVRLATGLASDRQRLAELRHTLRHRMEQSPLMDAPRFARDIEAAYREMWRQWCKTHG
jgi:predicted O-linked N-acetylglucosamine transferase (SPINDLY family)